MCLYSREIKPKIAENNIHCYKVLSKIDNDFYTPYTETLVSENVNKKVILEAFGEKTIDTEHINGDYKCTVSKGYIHCYISYIKALDEIGCISSIYIGQHNKSVLLCEVVIPKGTEYYEGINGDICAERIVFL